MQIGRQQRRPEGPAEQRRRSTRCTRAGFPALTAVLALTLAGGAVATSPAGAATARHAAGPSLSSAKTVPFSGHYKGNASLLINNGAVTIPSVSGKGTGTLVGASTVTGKGSSSSSAQCDPFTGTGSIVGAAAKIALNVIESKSSGCSSGESGPVTVTFTGLAVVTGGSGKASGARGSLKFDGTLKLGGTSGSQDGSYTVALNGKLTFKG